MYVSVSHIITLWFFGNLCSSVVLELQISVSLCFYNESFNTEVVLNSFLSFFQKNVTVLLQR